LYIIKDRVFLYIFGIQAVLLLRNPHIP